MNSVITTVEDLLVKTLPNGDCLEWQGAYNGKGMSMPAIKFDGKAIGTHLAVWALMGRKVPKGKLIYRTCSNKKCISPAHLKAGTMREVRALATAQGKCYRGGATETHCKVGHVWTDQDWFTHKSGKHKGLKNRRCKACEKARVR